MSKKDFMRGVETAVKANEAFIRKQSEATAELGKRIVQKIDEQGKIIDVILDTLNAQEKKELYDLQSAYDIADLGENEKEVLASFLLTLISKYGQDNDNQKDYYFAVKKHLEVTDVSSDFDLSLIENVDSRSEHKAMLQTVCEFLFLKTGDTSFLDEFEDEISYFGLSRKVIREIVEPIERIYDVLGLRGIVEHYIPAEPEEDEERKEKDSRIILDWAQDRDFCLHNGIKLDCFDRPLLVSSRNCIVRNFPWINIYDNAVENCLFENCKDITIDDSFVSNCIFNNIGSYCFSNVKVSLSKFQNSKVDDEDDALFILDNTMITESTFENIFLQMDSYLFNAGGACDIKKCSFINIHTSRSDAKLYIYENSSGKGIFKTTWQCTLIDENTCTGLNAINTI